MNIVSITHINVYTVCTKKHKWVTVRFVFLKALWLLYGDKIGRKQVWKWEIIGRVQTSQDVGGDRGDGGEERSRRQEETVSPPPPPAGTWCFRPRVDGLSLAFSRAWPRSGDYGARRGLTFSEVHICVQTCFPTPALART